MYIYIYIYTRGEATEHMFVSATEHPVTTHVFKRASGQTHFHYRIASLVDNIEMSLRLCKQKSRAIFHRRTTLKCI